MGTKFLIDTNILIYYFGDQLPKESEAYLDSIFCESFNISVISKIEFLGWQKYSEEQYLSAVEFLRGANMFELKRVIVEEAIRLRRQKQIKLPDAVIASTCLTNDFILVTRNQKDFEHIDGLKLYNPFMSV